MVSTVVETVSFAHAQESLDDGARPQYAARDFSKGESCVVYARISPLNVPALQAFQRLPHPDPQMFVKNIGAFLESFGGGVQGLSSMLVFADAEGKKVLFGSARGGTVFLLRNHKVKLVLDSEKPKYLSGPAQKSDQIVLSHDAALLESGSHIEDGDLQTIVEKTGISAVCLQFEDTDADLDGESDDMAVSSAPIQSAFAKKPPHKVLLRLPKSRGILLAVLFVLFLFGLLWGISALRQRRLTAFIAPYKTELETIRGNTGTDTAQTRIQAETLLTSMQEKRAGLKQNSLEYRSLESLIAETQTLYESLGGQRSIGTTEPFFNLSLAVSQFLVSDVAVDGESAVFLDSQKKELVNLNMKTKQFRVESISDVPNPKSITIYNDKTYVLGDGIYTQNRLFYPKQPANVSPTLMRSFGENLYVLDKEARDLFRVRVADAENAGAGGDSAADSSASASIYNGWFRATGGMDFAAISSVDIDGSVWLCTNTGQVLKFTQGRNSGFELKNLTKPFTSNLLCAVAPTADELYVAESSTKRLVRFNKKGEYQSAITSDALAAASGVFVMEEWKPADENDTNDLTVAIKHVRVFAVAGSYVYELQN